MPRDAITPGSVIVFYDGVCGFCNRTVRFVASRDREDRFRFTSLQGPLARELLLAHDVDPDELDTVYVLIDYGLSSERVYSRARGILRIFQELGGLWPLLTALRILPDSLLDAAYRSFASRRYQLFGKLDQCPLPEPQLRRKFVESREEPAGRTDRTPAVG